MGRWGRTCLTSLVIALWVLCFFSFSDLAVVGHVAVAHEFNGTSEPGNGTEMAVALTRAISPDIGSADAVSSGTVLPDIVSPDAVLPGIGSPETIFDNGGFSEALESMALDNDEQVVGFPPEYGENMTQDETRAYGKLGGQDELGGQREQGGQSALTRLGELGGPRIQAGLNELDSLDNRAEQANDETVPQLGFSLPPAGLIEPMLERMSLSEKIGQLLMVGFRGVGDLSDASMERILQDIGQGTVGGVILFDYDVTTQSATRNIVSLDQVGQLTRRLQRLAPIPLFIGVDQEGGRVARLKSIHGMPDLASPKFLGAGPLDATHEVYDLTAQYLATVGINVDFAPGVDVDIDPLSPAIGKLERSYSAYPDIVVSHAGAFAEALEKHWVMPAFKHFPGHGSAASDTHLGLADVTQTWEQKELVPYKMLLPKHPQAMVMVGHVFHRLLDDSYPASLSKNIITGLLRNDLGWTGLVITDDLDMQAISDYYSLKECVGLALNAGVDILLFGNNLQYDQELPDRLFQSVLDLVDDGEVSEERINEACGRVLRAKYALHPAFFEGLL